jgi:hypothetical protein
VKTLYLSRVRSRFQRIRTVRDLQDHVEFSDVAHHHWKLGRTGDLDHAYLRVDVGNDELYVIADVVLHPPKDGHPGLVVLDCVTPTTEEDREVRGQ